MEASQIRDLVSNKHSNRFFWLLCFIGVELIYNVVLVSGVQHSDSDIHIYVCMYMCVCVCVYIYINIYTHTHFFRFFSHIGYYKILSIAPCAKP